MAKTALKNKAEKKPKFKVPDLPAGDGAPRRAPRRDQVLLVETERHRLRSAKTVSFVPGNQARYARRLPGPLRGFQCSPWVCR